MFVIALILATLVTVAQTFRMRFPPRTTRVAGVSLLAALSLAGMPSTVFASGPAADAATPLSQTITMVPVPSQSFTTALIPLQAYSSSGLPVFLSSSTSNICAVANFKNASGGYGYFPFLILYTGGTCTIAAGGTGNSTYLPPPLVTESFTVLPVVDVSGQSKTGSGRIAVHLAGSSPANCTFVTTTFLGPPPGKAPVPPSNPGVDFPHGVLEFVTHGCSRRETIAVSMTLPVTLPPKTAFWVYGPTPGNLKPHWYTVRSIVSDKTITAFFADNDLGDDVFNGARGWLSEIHAIGGPGFPTARRHSARK